MIQKAKDVLEGDVTRKFLFKLAAGIVGSFTAILIVVFQLGGGWDYFNRLRQIPVSDIEKAVQYSVYEQPDRRDKYQNWMKEEETARKLLQLTVETLATEVKRLADSIEEWRKEREREK